jgi:DNA invertase Pin-like site-specific DNA recombinase
MSSQFAGQACGIYPRVSTEKQAKEGRTSLKDQEQACRDYADELDLIVDEDCVEPEAYTSTKMSRPGLNTLLATMRANKVPNLLIDTADRMTRQGIKVAYEFLQQFVEAGITLHVVSMELIVDDDKKVLDFLEAAYRAQLDNQQRTRKSHRARISRAKSGVFIRGSKPPYGYKYTVVDTDEMGNPTDRKLEPDERPFVDLGFPTIFAASPYAARREILRLYTEEGWSFQRIANRLNDAGVPTLTALLHRSGVRNSWWARVVNEIISHPVNQGQLINTFRFKPEKPGRAPRPDQVIQVNSKHGNPEALLDEQALAVVAKRRKDNRDGAYIRTSIHSGHTLLGGAIGKCGICGATLRVMGRHYKNQDYLYYYCTGHEKQPRSCPGMSVAAKNVDGVAWAEVVYALHNIPYDPSKPGSADEALAILDTGSAQSPHPSGPTLDQLKTVRAKLFHDAETYALEMVRVQSQLARDTLQRQIDRLEPEIAKADVQIAQMEWQSKLQTERANVLAHFMGKYTQYFAYLQVLDTDNESDIPIMAAILRALGAIVTVPPSYSTRALEKRKRQITASDTIDLGMNEPIQVVLTLTAGVGFPWTGNDELIRLLDERVARRIEWKRRHPGDDPTDFTAPRGTSA